MTTKIRTFLKDTRALLNDKSGANMVEYILLVGVVALLCVAAFRIFGNDVSEQIQEQGDSVGEIRSEFDE